MSQLNQIIKHDDLHWNKDEKKFVTLSEKEIDQVCGACLLSGITDPEDVTKVVRWAELARAYTLTLKGLLSGRLGVILQEDDEPGFYDRTNEEIEAIENLEGIKGLYTEEDE